MPAISILEKEGRKDLLARIAKFGGVPEVRRRLGLKRWRSPPVWPEERFYGELKPICKQLRRMPTQRELLEMGRADLQGQVNKRGGQERVASELGFPTERQASGRQEKSYWQEWANLENELLPLCQKLGRFPTRPELYQSGHKSAARALYYHGGVTEVASRLGYSTTGQMQPDLKNVEFVSQQLREIIKKTGHFPTKTELKSMGKDTLGQAIIKYHGGFEKVAGSIGMTLPYTTKGRMRDWKFVKETLLALQEEIGRFPTGTDLIENGHGGLRAAIYRYHGGLSEVRRRLEGQS